MAGMFYLNDPLRKIGLNFLSSPLFSLFYLGDGASDFLAEVVINSDFQGIVFFSMFEDIVCFLLLWKV